ncbi:MAG: hypothetical protein H6625_09930 [Bdellovibrionaceae bacterium]|nr:hypothetical protein [Pseudobdellovibrionaceae bacterium]
MKIMLFLIVLFSFNPIWAFKGFVYEIGSNRKNVLFNIERVNTINGDNEYLSLKFIDPQGKIAVTEEAFFEKDQLVKYLVNYHRRNEQGEISVKDGKVYFHYTENGKTKNSEEKWVYNFIVGLSMKKYITKHWQDLVDGKTLKVRFGVDYRRDTVGFSLFRLKDEEKETGIMTVKMEPSSFIIAAIVDPIIFNFDMKTKELISFVGRTKPKQLVNGKWKDLDGETLYIWE